MRFAAGKDFITCQTCNERVEWIDFIEQRLKSDSVARTIFKMEETAIQELDAQALEQILFGHVQAITGEANQISGGWPSTTTASTAKSNSRITTAGPAESGSTCSPRAAIPTCGPAAEMAAKVRREERSAPPDRLRPRAPDRDLRSPWSVLGGWWLVVGHKCAKLCEIVHRSWWFAAHQKLNGRNQSCL
jgi:hypothetical protein